MDAFGRLIHDLRRSDHITDALASLHWLRVPERIMYRAALLTFRALHGEAPQYLSEKLVRVANISSRHRLRSSTSQLVALHCRQSFIFCGWTHNMESATYRYHLFVVSS